MGSKSMGPLTIEIKKGALHPEEGEMKGPSSFHQKVTWRRNFHSGSL